MNFIKITHVSRGETKKAWVNKDKIIYIEPYEGDSNDPTRTLILVEDIGSPFFVAETCDDVFLKIELANKKEL